MVLVILEHSWPLCDSLGLLLELETCSRPKTSNRVVEEAGEEDCLLQGITMRRPSLLHFGFLSPDVSSLTEASTSLVFVSKQLNQGYWKALPSNSCFTKAIGSSGSFAPIC